MTGADTTPHNAEHARRDLEKALTPAIRAGAVMFASGGEIDKVRSFLSPEVAGAFDAAVAERKAKGLDIHADFMGLTELTLSAASFDRGSNLAEITIRFGAELISAAKDASGTVVEGDPKMPRKQRDVWTFSRTMGSADPNWALAATGG